MKGRKLWNYLEKEARKKYERPDWILVSARINGTTAEVKLESSASKRFVNGVVDMPEEVNA